MDNSFEIFNYLTDDDKKRIAERVFEEELRKHFREDIEKRNQEIFHDFPTVYHRVLDQYIREMNLTHDNFAPAFKPLIEKEVNDILSGKDDDNSVAHHIRWRFQVLAEEIISEDKSELKEIIRDKVFRCCNETLLIAFLSDIVRGMNLDKAVKQIIKDSEGNKV